MSTTAQQVYRMWRSEHRSLPIKRIARSHDGEMDGDAITFPDGSRLVPEHAMDGDEPCIADWHAR